jgi:hypothetical protein
LLTSANSYSDLLNKLLFSGEQVAFSTLNYNCLFEQAVKIAVRKVEYFNNTPSSNSDTIMWKLLSSCSFLHFGGVTATRGVSFGAGVTFGTGIKNAKTHLIIDPWL